jgi:hypothetical protein
MAKPRKTTRRRGPHGAPWLPARISIWCTKAQKAKFVAGGGSPWLRHIITEAKL